MTGTFNELAASPTLAVYSARDEALVPMAIFAAAASSSATVRVARLPAACRR